MNDVRIGVAILGSGRVAADLISKLLKAPGHMQLVLVSDTVPQSSGLLKARDLGIPAATDGINAILRDSAVRIVFDATTAKAHAKHAKALGDSGRITVDLTPAWSGVLVVPAVNLSQHLDGDSFSLVSSAAQATVPLAYAVSRVGPASYVEVVSTIASSSAGAGTRQNIDELTAATARALERLGGAKRGKAIIIFSPAEPPIVMRNVVYAVPEDGFHEDEVAESLQQMVGEVQRYARGYRLRREPEFEERDTPWGKKRVVVLLLEIEGAGDSMPPFGGNLDILTSAARRVGNQLARQLLALL